MNTKEFIDKWLNEHVRHDTIETTPWEQAYFKQVLCDVCEACKRTVIDEACEWIENEFHDVESHEYRGVDTDIRSSSYFSIDELVDDFRTYMEGGAE